MRQPWRPLQALLPLLLCGCHSGAAVAESASDLSDEAAGAKALGAEACFFVGHGYEPHLAVNATSENCFSVGDAEACQQGCASNSECFFFTFWGANGTCCLSGADATYKAEEGAVTGPKVCAEAPAACIEVPGEGFPGLTEAESELAWPSHRVPKTLECWPKNWTDGTYLPCKTLKVLEDSARGFPGSCTGMTKIPVVPQFETCESLCKRDSMCSVFQVEQSAGPTGAKSCWLANGTSGTNCYINPAQTFVPLRAVRYQQGEVRVLKKLSGVVVRGLTNAFGPYWFLNISDATSACRLNCYSSIVCQYWQYSRTTGCWLEDPTVAGAVASPPTTQTWDSLDPSMAYMVDGEYIQHTCSAARGLAPPIISYEAVDYGAAIKPPPLVEEAVPTTEPIVEHDVNSREVGLLEEPTTAEPTASSGLPWYCWLVLAGMLAVCVVAGVLGYMASQSEEDEYRAGFLAEDGKISHFRKEGQEGNYGPRTVIIAEQDGAAGGTSGHGANTGVAETARAVAHEVQAAGRRASAAAEDAVHRVANHALPGQHSRVPSAFGVQEPHAPLHFGGAPVVGPTRDQLLQYAHQPRP